MRDRYHDKNGIKPRCMHGTIVYTYTPPALVEHAKRLERMLAPRGRVAARRREWALGHTGPMPWLDSAPQGGNANPKRRKREHPSGHHSCGFY